MSRWSSSWLPARRRKNQSSTKIKRPSARRRSRPGRLAPQGRCISEHSHGILGSTSRVPPRRRLGTAEPTHCLLPACCLLAACLLPACCLLAACLLPACCLLTATASDRAASYLAYRLSPCVVCTGGARLAFSLGCRLPLHPDGLPAASFRGRRGRRATRLDTGGAGSTQPHHSRARESSRATSAAHRSGPG